MPLDPADRDQGSLLDVWIAARRVREFVTGMGPAAFLADVKTQSAVIHQILIIGEATKRISLGYREKHSSVPWAKMAGMRDRLIHRYDDLDLREIWDTTMVDVPRLLAEIEPLIPPEEA